MSGVNGAHWCSYCEHKSQDPFKFCPNCGRSHLVEEPSKDAFCVACNIKLLVPNQKRCHECGAVQQLPGLQSASTSEKDRVPATLPPGRANPEAGDMTTYKEHKNTCKHKQTDGPEKGEGTDDPEKGEGTDDPVKGEGTDDPVKGEGTDDPAKGEGTDDRAKGEGTDDPEKGEGTDDPAKGEGTDNPAKGEGTDDPAKGEGTDDPTKGEGTDDPEKGEGTGDPAKGEGTDDPAKGEGTDDPAKGEGTDDPEKGEWINIQMPTQGVSYVKKDQPEELFSGTQKKDGNRRRFSPGGKHSEYRSHFEVPKGLCADPNCSIEVVFHALLPKLMWDWDDSTSAMYIRFGNKDLGSWSHSCGPMKVHSECDDGLFEVIVGVVMDATLLRQWSPIHYKYYVYSSKMKEEDCYEYLHGYKDLSNRCLRLENDQYKQSYGGKHHHYDTVVYPRVTKERQKAKEESLVARLLKGFAIRANDSEETEEEPQILPGMFKTCFQIYLKGHHHVLSQCDYPRGFTIGTFVEEIECVYHSLKTLRVSCASTRAIQRCEQPNFHKVLNEWMESIVVNLKKVSQQENRKWMVSALTLANCIYVIKSSKPGVDEVVVPLLRMLRLKPDLQTRQCPELQLLRQLLPFDMRAKEITAETVLRLCTILMETRDVQNLEWLAVLPLYHFLKQCSHPFQSIEMNPERIQWCESDKDLQKKLGDIKSRIRPGFIRQQLLEDFRPLLEADPLLLQTFIYLCPQANFYLLCKQLQIPPFLATAWLAHEAKGVQFLSIIKARGWTDLIACIRELTVEHHKTAIISELNCLQSMVDASLLLYQRLIRYLSSSPHHMELFIASVSLVLVAISQLFSLCHDHNKMKTTLHELLQKLNDWIIKPNVMGGSVFGGRVDIYTYKAGTEIELWNSLLTLSGAYDVTVTNEWEEIIGKLIQQRITAVPEKKMIDIVCLLDKNHTIHHVLLDTILSAGTQAVIDILSLHATSAEEFERLAATGSKRVGSLLGNLLKKQYPCLKPTSGGFLICLTDLLKWHLWPNFIKIYAGESKLKEVLPFEAQTACMCATTEFQDLCSRIESDNITVKDLKEINEKPEQMRRLCEAALGGGDKEEVNEMSCLSIQQALQLRLQVLHKLERCQTDLSNLCNHIPHTMQGLSMVEEGLKKDFSAKKTCELYTRKDGNIEISCFPSACTLTDFADDFFVMTEEYANKLFLTVWVDTMDTAIGSNPNLTVYDLYQHVWQPTVHHCVKLLDELITQSIKLVDVDKFFAKQNLEVQLTNFFLCVITCTRQCKDGTWIQGTLTRMNAYWDLCNSKLENVANDFLKFKRALNLKGDFRDVKRISKGLKTSMREHMLKDVQDNLLRTGEFLKSIASQTDPNKLACLQTFVECRNVIQWLQEETTNITALQNFVTIALATAAGGEGDLADDLLSNLQTVGTGFGSVIYELPSDTGFETLSQRCTVLWEALRDNPRLPSMLEECNTKLDWYKSIKETQGSVETTSFGQMRNILKYGYYRIGSRSSQAFHNIHGLIELQLHDTDRQLPKTSYNLDELRDLESKLVLITGSKAENRHEVDQYLDTLHSVCQIAEVLLLLQQSGNTKYMGWVLKFPCTIDMVDTVAKLQGQAKTMENEQWIWTDEVKKARENFYELNYYTMLQLLSLREELGLLRHSAPASSNALALLYSISSEVTSPAVLDAVLNIDEQQTSSDTVPSESDENVSQFLPEKQPEERMDAESVTTTHSLVVQPVLTMAHLNEKQKQIHSKLVDYYGLDSSFSLFALEKCGNDATPYDVENWITENEVHYIHHSQEPEEETFVDDDDTILESDSDTETELSSYSGDSASKTRPSIVVTNDQPMDEFHPVPEPNVQSPTLNRGSDFFPVLTSQHEQKSSSEGIIFQRANDSYLSLHELGCTLQKLSSALPMAVTTSRTFPKVLRQGSPNLLVTSPEYVLKTALALYMEDESLPLPTLEEMLICNDSTTVEEISLLWRRAIGDPGFKRIFCLVHAEKPSFRVCDRALYSLNELTQGCTDPYRLVIICSSENEDQSHIISRLYSDYRHFGALYDLSKYQEYLKVHFTNNESKELMASSVDYEKSCVRIVRSTRSGMGKSLYVRRMADLLQDRVRTPCITIPIHGPIVSPDSVVESLKEHMSDYKSSIFHFDVYPTVLHKVDAIIFCLLILKGLSDSHGSVWRCHRTQLYVIEITLPEQQEETCGFANSGTCALLELLPSVICISPVEIMLAEEKGTDNRIVLMDHKKFEDAAYQRVYQYLSRYRANEELDSFSYSENVEGNRAHCLEVILSYCGIQDPSWSDVQHFVNFLDIQLQSCEMSTFCDANFTGDVMAGLKGFIVKFMIYMSRDFATSSIQGEIKGRISPISGHDDLEQYQIEERRLWEQSPHPYIFFNQDRVSITFLGFMLNQSCELIDPRTRLSLKPRITMTPKLRDGLIQNRVDFSENCLRWQRPVMIDKLATVMGICLEGDPDDSYVLTMDNLIKILAIQMRFRCGIPVVIMGETGCGKTRLIQYMCKVAKHGISGENLLMMKVHGGTTETDIKSIVRKAEEVASKNKKDHLETVLFFDEANTTDALGLIKEIMCDRRLHGKPISEDIKLIAACNPYRMHSAEMIKRLDSAGLGFYVRSTETQQKLGKIPLRQLVYRVVDLPPSMRPLVYDFGQLNADTEKGYIHQIVKSHINKKHTNLFQQRPAESDIDRVVSVLAWSHEFMRKRKDECSFVSLRDVERAMIVFEYFYSKMDIYGPRMNEKAGQNASNILDDFTRSIVLAISVCYNARLQYRDQYERGVSQQLMISGGVERFRNEIQWCQEVLLDSMELGHNIARNAALRENIFMMTICIELRIPLFLVGKPGSSKSLAKAIVANSMKGHASSKCLLKEFKRVQMFSYQCSQLSTPASVIEVFNTARTFQKKRDTSKFVSVVVLDEVGLAEDSPNLPLKALHPLLEDGTKGADSKHQFVKREKRVAFIGISNWALDPAKMNRGIMVTRGDPDVNELEGSARGICSDKTDDPVREMLEPYFKVLAIAYKTICEKQEREFFGLRDFYCLVKMLYWMCDNSRHPLTWAQLRHAIQRNFGGLVSRDVNPMEEFRKEILKSKILKVPPIISIDCLELIKASLRTRETTWHGENRYLLFLTENYAALDILKHYLSDALGSSATLEPFILFGSSFPKDQDYTQVCRNINQIKICMETGRTVILLNLENLYESLYDLLNQYYIHLGDSRYVDLGLQTHRVKCRVHNNFKLIMIAERSKVYEKFPIPLINRLEKHFVLTSSVLTDWQMEVQYRLEAWVDEFTTVDSSHGKKFEKSDAFICFQKDTPAAVVFQATKQLQLLCLNKIQQKTLRAFESGIMGTISPKALVKEKEGSPTWKQAVLLYCHYLLLQTVSLAALIRLKATPLKDHIEDLTRIYFDVQCHSSLESFLIQTLFEGDLEGGILLQVTCHSHLLSPGDLERLRKSLHLECSQMWSFLLQEFDTELTFTNKISLAFQREPGNSGNHLLIIQCDSGHTNGDLIACARYRVYDERAKSTRKVQKGVGTTHVLFIIHIPQQTIALSGVGFQGDPWICTHFDELQNPEFTDFTVHEVMRASLSELFIGKFESHEIVCSGMLQSEEKQVIREVSDHSHVKPEMVMSTSPHQLYECETGTSLLSAPFASESLPQILPNANGKPKCVQMLISNVTSTYNWLHGCIHAAACRLQDSSKERITARVAILVGLIPRKLPCPLDTSTFCGILVQHMHKLLCERVGVHENEDWVLNEALNARKLQSGGTFLNTLARKLNDVIVPIFAKIIAFVDRNYNLDLVQENTPKSQLWLAMFQDSQIMGFHYEEMVTQNHMSGMGGRVLEETYMCQLPFSWLIKETIDDQWNIATRIAGDDKEKLYTQLCTQVSETPVCKALNSVPPCHCEELCMNYLHDFIRSIHKCNHKQAHFANLEYKLIADALNSMVSARDFSSSVNGLGTLASKIVAVHVVHYFSKSEILWFGQLASHMPGILEQLLQKAPKDSKAMVLHLYAVERALECLEPPLEKDQATLKQWLNDLRLSQNTIDSILSLPSQHDLHRRVRLQWQLIRALQLFVEHILLNHDEMVRSARKLCLYLKGNSDFLKCGTIVKVKNHLHSMENDIKGMSPKARQGIKRSCRKFFMELVSTLCFGGQTAPEPELTKMLMDMVFTENKDIFSTKRFSPYDDVGGESDAVPVIRSFLLQLLLHHNTGQVREHLDEYFERSHKVIGGDIDQELCLVCIQCYEDALYKKSANQPFHEQVLYASKMLCQGKTALHHQSLGNSIIDMHYIEGVAQVRFALSIVAELLHKLFVERYDLDDNDSHLMQVASDVCTAPEINHIDTSDHGHTSGPAIYVLKLLVRRYGRHCLEKITQSKECSWVVPQELRRYGEGQLTTVPFVIYGRSYNHLRHCIHIAAYEKDFKNLVDAAKDLAPKEVRLLILALYETSTLINGSTLPNEHLLPELDIFITDCKVLSKELQSIARALLNNKQGGPLAELRITPGQSILHRTLGAIVVHAAVVLDFRKKVEILQLFGKMMTNPTALVHQYLPTMPEDDLHEAMRVFTRQGVLGKFYECSRGHPYYVSECGRPIQMSTCGICGEPIGGTDHKLVQHNRKARSDDRTQTGYCLGLPDHRGSVPAPERSLSPAASCIVRILMHSALLWASCNNMSGTEELSMLVKPAVHPLPEFFWGHLEKDLELLGKATGKSMDEAALLIHLVISEILTKEPATSTYMSTVSTLSNTDDRNQWELLFNKTYVQPILKQLEKRIEGAITVIQDDKKEDPLFWNLVYEKVAVAESIVKPHFWTYRSRISLEHLSLTLQNQHMKEKHPVLHEFLQQEHILRATQYLPDIVKLQQLLYNSFHHRLDHKEAQQYTIKDFLGFVQTDHGRSEYERMVRSFSLAWELVGNQLKFHSRLRVEEKYLQLLVISTDTPLEYLIPTTTGAGACSTALVDFLLLAHNNFIERCRELTTQKEQRFARFWKSYCEFKTSKKIIAISVTFSIPPWDVHKVPISHLQRCHLLDYEQQLLPIVLSHCQYSLTVGKGQKITYDLPALEKHILDRFIHGKPLILSSIPQVAYRKDIYTATTFAAVRKKVVPQVTLQPRVQQEILQELHSVDKLREALDVVDIVLGFLSSGGGNASMPLRMYVRGTLKMKKRLFSKRAQEHCNLGHILSLWEILSVELSRQLALNGQEPFDMMTQQFLVVLEKDQEEALTAHLRFFNLDKLLGVLYEFIETEVKHSPDRTKDWTLVETLEPFLEQSRIPPISNLHEHIPDTITVAQAVATWKHTVQYRDKLRHEVNLFTIDI